MALTNETVGEGLHALSNYLNAVTLMQFLLAAAIFITSYVVLTVVLFIATRVVRKITEHTRTKLDDMLLDALQRPAKLLALAISTYLALSYSLPPFLLFGQTLEEYLLIAVIIIAAMTLSRTVDAFIKWYGQEITPKRKVRAEEEMFPMVRKAITIVLYAAALIIVLDLLGIEIAPFVAGLGIAGLAVALALQESLTNFFAGVYLLADKPVRTGDYIKLSTGEEGYVEEIGWRSTRVKTLKNNIVIIPNSKLAQSMITNYSAPGNEMAILVKVTVAYDSDIDAVESLLKEVSKKVVSETPGAVKEFEPIVNVTGFQDSGVEFTLAFRVTAFWNQWRVATAMRKEILKAFRRNGVEIPFPTRTVIFK